MGKRRKSRELAMQMLFQADLGRQEMDQVRKTFWHERADVDESTRGFADDLANVATVEGEKIDRLIEKHAQHWRIDRMATVDRNLLRTGVAELLGYPRTPRPVIINEALEIARKYSSPDSIHFINGILDAIAQEISSKKEAG